MLRYKCLNVWCLESSHDTPMCPYKPPVEQGSMTPAELTTLGHLQQLSVAGVFDSGPALPRITITRRPVRAKRAANPWRPLVTVCVVITLMVAGLATLL